MSEDAPSIARRVARQHGLTLEEMRTPSTAAKYAWPRQHAMAEMYDTGRVSLKWIAVFLGLTDHGTVHYGIRAHRRRQATYPQAVNYPVHNAAEDHRVTVLTSSGGV